MRAIRLMRLTLWRRSWLRPEWEAVSPGGSVESPEETHLNHHSRGDSQSGITFANSSRLVKNRPQPPHVKKSYNFNARSA